MKVLVIKLSSLGDLFHVLPAVHAIKIGLDARIDWVVQKEYASLVRCFSDVDEAVPFDRQRLIPELPVLWRRLRSVTYDYAIDMQGLLKSAIITAMARAACRIGPSYHREGSRLFYHRIAGPADRGRHAVAQAMDVARHLGLPEIEPSFPVQFPTVSLEGEGLRIGFVPFSRWQSKNWPCAHYIELAHKIFDHAAASIYLLGSPAEAKGCEELARDIGSGARSLAGRYDLPHTGGAIRALDLMVASDTGPAHIAAAAGIPCVVLYGPTDPARTGPYGDAGIALREPETCGPCLKNKCRLGHLSCMNLLTPALVFERIRPLLDGARSNAAPHNGRLS